ncbi:MAG: hypothetical protein ACJ8R9_20165 [Steroidobacteraceae bacterium]
MLEMRARGTAVNYPSPVVVGRAPWTDLRFLYRYRAILGDAATTDTG